MKPTLSPLAYANVKDTLTAWQIKITVKDVINTYSERHRYFHTCEHLNYIIQKIADVEQSLPSTNRYHDELILTAIFHDYVYVPWRTDNEERSAEKLKENFPLDVPTAVDMLNKVVANILATKTHQSETAVQGIFNKFDFGCLDDANFHDLKFMYEKENQIFKEYQFTDLNKYIEGRVSFLSSKEFKNPHIKEIINYVKNRTYNIAIYPGSFNPFHIGHYNVLEKAEQLFDKVIVVMGVNADKKSSLDDLSFKKLKEQLPDRQVERHEGNIIKKFFIGNERNPVLIRGLRNGFDLMYEENYLTWCKEFHPILRYSMILCDKDYSHVSSSSIRSIDEKWILEKYIIPPYVV